MYQKQNYIEAKIVAVRGKRQQPTIVFDNVNAEPHRVGSSPSSAIRSLPVLLTALRLICKTGNDGNRNGLLG